MSRVIGDITLFILFFYCLKSGQLDTAFKWAFYGLKDVISIPCK